MRIDIPGFTSASDMVDWPRSAELIKDSVPAVGLGQMVGASYGGKSYVCLDLAWRVSAGLPDWFGHEILRPGYVFYYVKEGRGGIPERLRAMREFYETPPPERFVLVTDPEQHPLTREGLPQFLTNVLAITEGEDVSLVIIDTQSMLLSDLGVENENDNAEMSRVFNDLRAFSDELRTLVLLVHHTGKDTSRGSRGASSQFANTDFQAEITFEGTAPNSHHYLRVVKHKDGIAWPESREFYLRRVSEDIVSPVVVPGTAEAVGMVDRLAAERQAAVDSVLAVLRTAGSEGLPKPQVMESTGLSKAMLDYALNFLLHDAKVEKRGTTRNTRYFISEV